MRQTVIVISKLVDSTLAERQRDTEFLIFKTLEELDEYSRKIPIRANALYFSEDILTIINPALDYLHTLLQRKYVAVDKVVMVAEPESKALDAFKMIIETNGITNWIYVTGSLSREYMVGVITGSALDDSVDMKRKVVIRVPKTQYVQIKSQHIEQMKNEHYVDDDSSLETMEDEVVVPIAPMDIESIAQIYNIIGEPTVERRLYTFIIAQYLSLQGKTIIIESDPEYHQLGDMITKSTAKYEEFLIDDFYRDSIEVLQRIADSSATLICLLSRGKFNYNYQFIINTLYSNLSDSVKYIMKEGNFGDEPPASPYTIAFPATVPECIKASAKVRISTLKDAFFVGIHLNTPKQIRLQNSKQFIPIVEDITHSHGIVKGALVELNSLEIGGDTYYDIGSVIHLRKGLK